MITAIIHPDIISRNEHPPTVLYLFIAFLRSFLLSLYTDLTFPVMAHTLPKNIILNTLL
jgi:hypothetical protein